MTKEVSLSVNKTLIPLDYFVQGFIDHILGGILSALEGTGEIKTLDVSIEDGKVAICLNNAHVPINSFAGKIIRNTIAGMVSSLKGVGEIDRIELNIRR